LKDSAPLHIEVKWLDLRRQK